MSSDPNPYQSPLTVSGNAGRGSSAKKTRSPFWIVSTHILTTGVAMPLVAVNLAFPILAHYPLSPMLAFLAQLAIIAGGYVAGTFYSLSYLRKVTAIRNPEACAKASVIVFVLLAILWLGVKIVFFHLTDPVTVVSWIVFYVVICWAFAKITRTGFLEMAAASTDP